MSPPIREAGHGKALQGALATGVLQVCSIASKYVYFMKNCCSLGT